MELDLFSDLFICPSCNEFDSGKFCSNCGKRLKIEYEQVADQLSKRYKYFGFIDFQEWLSANHEIAEYHQLSQIHTDSGIVLCKEHPPNSGLNLEIIIIVYEHNEGLDYIKNLISEYVKIKRSAIKHVNALPRKQRSKKSAFFLQKLEFRVIGIKNGDEKQTARQLYKKVNIRTLTGVAAGGLKRFLFSQHFLRSSFNLSIIVDLSILDTSRGRLFSSAKRIFDIVQHQAQVIARQTLDDPILKEKKPNKLLQLIVAVVDGFKDYFIILVQYIRNPYYFPELIAERRGIPLGKIFGLYFVGLICSITIPWALSGGYLNANNLSLFSNLPPFISDLAELTVELLRTSLVCVILHLVIRLSGKKGSLSSLLLCFLFYESFMQIIERPARYLTGPFLLRLTNNNFNLQYPIQLFLLCSLAFIAVYFVFPILYSVYKTSRWVMTLGYLVVVIFFSAWTGFLTGFSQGWSQARFGQEIDYRGLQVFYKDSVSLVDAQRLQQYLSSIGFGKENAVSVQILKHDSEYIFREVVRSGALNDSGVKNAFSNLAYGISQYVFHGAPVKVQACDKWLKPIAEFNMTPGDQWFVYAKGNYSISHPSSWRLGAGGKPDVKFLLYSSSLGVNMSLVIEDLSGKGISFDRYIQLALDQIKNHYSNFNLFENSTQTAHGRMFQKLVYNVDINQSTIRVEQYIFVTGEMAYILGFRLDTKDLDESTINISESIMDTFSIR